MVTDTVMVTVPKARSGVQSGLSLLSAVFLQLSRLGSAFALIVSSGLLSAQELGAGRGAEAPGGGVSQKPNWFFEPRLSVTETITDHSVVDGSASGSNGDQVTQISPGIRLEGRTARVKGYFDYALTKILYGQNAERNRTQNALTAFGTLEAVDNWLFLEVSGNISQQNVSAFGPQSSNNASINANSTETSTYMVSPYIRGRLLGFADYQFRYRRTTTETQSNQIGGNDTEAWTGSLRGDTALASLGWALDASRNSAEYHNGRSTEADRIYGTLIWRLDPQFRINLSAGTETNNYLGLDKESRNTHGYGFDWSPTPRTSLSVFRERRFFGDGHRITLSHRTPLTAWKFSDTRDVSVVNQSGTVGVGTFYDLVYALSATAPGVDPNDPLARAAWTNMFFLLTGLSPKSIIPADFLASQASLQRQRELSFAITGVRNTVTFMATQSRREALANQTIAIFTDSFQAANVINQRGFSVNWSNRLTADSSLSAALMHMTTSGESSAGSNLQATQKTLTVNFSTRLGPKTTASLGYRRAEFDSETNPYTENALTGTLNARF